MASNKLVKYTYAQGAQMSNHSKKKAQDFLAKKKEETKGAMKEGEKKNPDTSKMPEGLRKHFEKKNGKK